MKRHDEHLSWYAVWDWIILLFLFRSGFFNLKSFSELKKLPRSEKKSARLFEFQLFPNFFVEKCKNFAKKQHLKWTSDCAQEDVAKCG
jgi:hypothetical protein